MADDVAPHSHGHAWNGIVSGWSGWRRDPVRVTIVVTLAVCLLATLVAAVAVWPDGSRSTSAADQADQFGFASEQVSATVSGITDGPCAFDETSRCRTFTFEIDSGSNAGEEVQLPDFSLEFEQNLPPASVGDGVILDYEPTTDTYSYADIDRRVPLVALTVLFAIVVVALARFRGVLALLAMVFTVVVLIAFVAPAVLDGRDPLVVAVVAASAIAFVTLFLTHGISPPTAVALVSTLAALMLTLALSALFFELASFTGLATEEATILPLLFGDIDLASLLLGGAILGALGALDDVTVTQVATVIELREHRPDLPWRRIVASGIRIGRSHIASTVNTLLLAYAGASIPLLLLFSASNQSLGLVANSEVVAVEIVRTMCGSIGLVAAVPISTGLAALVATTSAPRQPTSPTGGLEPPPPPASWDDFGPDREFWGGS